MKTTVWRRVSALRNRQNSATPLPTVTVFITLICDQQGDSFRQNERERKSYNVLMMRVIFQNTGKKWRRVGHLYMMHSVSVVWSSVAAVASPTVLIELELKYITFNFLKLYKLIYIKLTFSLYSRGLNQDLMELNQS